MNFGLSDEVLARIEIVISHHPAVERALLYGSRAKGTEKPGSDIDLTLIGEDLDEQVLGRIDYELEELLLPYRVDLSIFKSLTHPELIDHIQRVGKVLYERGRNRESDESGE